ncbi:hypothetical protein KKE03_04835 [Patescibacteria group bacterium]|nr:hypothetical protein [Patescibacteria group bacterium]
MFNWSSDLSKADKKSKDYKIWKLEQLINFGLNREKLSEKEVKKYWKYLNLDPDKKRALKYLIWGKQS